MKEFAALREKFYIYLTYGDSEDKKRKKHKKVFYKKETEVYFEVTQLENKINHLKNKIK